MKQVLIAGASGLVGTALKHALELKGYGISTLSHSQPTDQKQNRFHWNPAKGFIDESCLKDIDHVINLSGVGVFDKRWTSEYKQAIRDSRINSTALLAKAISKHASVQTFVNASAIGIYGADTGTSWMDESSAIGTDYLAQVVKAWEGEFFRETSTNTRKVALRIGIVLSDKGGALPQMAMPIKYSVGSPMGSGLQYVSWIHLADLCALFIFALEQASLKGVYNAVAPEPVTNETLTVGISKRLNKKLWLPNIPPVALKLLLGREKASVLLGGTRVKCDALIQKGFVFHYKTLDEALHSFF